MLEQPPLPRPRVTRHRLLHVCRQEKVVNNKHLATVVSVAEAPPKEWNTCGQGRLVIRVAAVPPAIRYRFVLQSGTSVIFYRYNPQFGVSFVPAFERLRMYVDFACILKRFVLRESFLFLRAADIHRAKSLILNSFLGLTKSGTCSFRC